MTLLCHRHRQNNTNLENQTGGKRRSMRNIQCKKYNIFDDEIHKRTLARTHK